MTDARNGKGNSKLLYCPFRGKNQYEVYKLIVGPSVFTCDECVDLCSDIVHEEIQGARAESSGHKPPAPRETHIILDQYVIGQERAKKVLAIVVYNHYKRLNQRDKKDGIELGESNILMTDLTGPGKTLLAETLTRLLSASLTIVDATTLAEVGYVGEDVEDIIRKLLQKCDYNVEKVQTGIVYIDEIDKVSRKSDNPSIAHNVFGEDVRQVLLKLIKSTVASIPPQGDHKHPQQEFLQAGTRNILFICGGALAGLEQVIQNRSARDGIGFSTEVRSREMGKKIGEVSKEVEPEDLVKFGLIPELVGCLPVIATLDELDEVALMQILTELRNVLTRQYAKPFEMEGVDPEFRLDALKAVICKALECKTGAYDLRSILEGILLDTMYEIPSQQDVSKVVIGEGIIGGSSQPLMIYENSEEPAKAIPEV